MIDRLRECSFMVAIELNPLHWRVRAERFSKWGLILDAGPVRVVVLW